MTELVEHVCEWAETTTYDDLAKGRRVYVCGVPGHPGENLRVDQYTGPAEGE